MKHFEKMVEYYRNHPEEAKNILKHAGKLEPDKWKDDTVEKGLKNADEIVLENVKMLHLEQMNETSLWIGCYTEDSKIYHLNISAKDDKLFYWWSDETP